MALIKSDALIGAHISTEKGLHFAFERGEAIGCTAMQIFTKGCRSWKSAPLDIDEIRLFKQCAQQSPIQSVIAHAGYLINLASKDSATEILSIRSLVDEITRCAQLGIPFLVLHPGAHVGTGEQEGINKIACNLNNVLEKTDPYVSILLETTAGQGTVIGYTFDQLKQIRDLCNDKNRIGICMDICHIFAAGYNLITAKDYKKTIENFDKILGLSILKTIHINDSSGDIGSHLDRHAPIGKGNIPLIIFKKIMRDKRLANIPKILETPTDASLVLWKKEIELLKEFANEQ